MYEYLYTPILFAIDVLWRDKAFVMRHGGYGYSSQMGYVDEYGVDVVQIAGPQTVPPRTTTFAVITPIHDGDMTEEKPKYWLYRREPFELGTPLSAQREKGRRGRNRFFCSGLKGTVDGNFWYRFFHESAPNRPLMNVKKKFYFCEFAEKFLHEV